MKIEVNQVAEILKRNELEPKLLRQVVEEMNMVAAGKEEDEDKAPAIKKQYCIVVSDPNGEIPKHDFVGWILQIPENESVATTLERVYRGAYEFNTTKKGRLMPVKTVGEAIEFVNYRHFKEAQVWPKTKAPVLVVVSNNQIPKDESTKDEARRGRMD